MTIRKFRRLYQPQNPMFWLMLVLNVLSSILIWMLHSRDWPFALMLLLTLFALCNAGLGIALMIRLIRSPVAGEADRAE